MKPFQFSAFLMFLILLAFNAQVWAEPVGELPPVSDAAKQMYAAQGKDLSEMADSVPLKAEIGLPVYPGSYFTGSFSGEGMLPSVILASKDPIDKVKAWYAEQPGLTWSDQWQLFHVGEKYTMMKTESVYLQDISADPQVSTGGLAFDMTGMQTQITISYEPRTGTQ